MPTQIYAHTSIPTPAPADTSMPTQIYAHTSIPTPAPAHTSTCPLSRITYS